MGGVLEGLVDRAYRQLGRWHLTAYRAGYLVGGIVLSFAGAFVFGLYEPMSAGEYFRTVAVAAVFVLASLLWGLLVYKRRIAHAEAWLNGVRDSDNAKLAWREAVDAPRLGLRAQLPVAVLVGGVPVALYLTLAFGLGPGGFAVVLASMALALTYPALLNVLAIELWMRPIAREAALVAEPALTAVRPGFSLRWRLFVTLPLINAATAIFVGVLASDDRSIASLGPDLALALAVGLASTLILTVMLAQTVLGPVGGLLGAIRSISGGAVGATAPVVSADELGELTSSFNRMSHELRSSREAQLASREDERRRLRHDLHDGLAGSLTAIGMQAGLARDLAGRDPDRAAEILRGVETQTRDAVAELRRVVEGLRPLELDALGLVGSLHERARKASGNGLQIEVDVEEPLPALPGPVEVAAYRVASEGLTNAIRHADARRCTVTLAPRPQALAVSVADDGRGIDAHPRAGGGLASMRERVADLGGSISVAALPGGGTVVEAVLPVEGAPTRPRAPRDPSRRRG